MKYIVYSKPACPMCDQAKALLTSRSLNFEVVNLDIGQSKEYGESYISRDALLSKIPNARTMPQIIREDTSSSVVLGGFSELKKHLFDYA